MVDVVTSCNRHKYESQLALMHEDRRRIFVESLKWDIPVVDGRFEKDQFDNDDAVYLLALDAKKETHLGSVRLLPSSKPHLLGDVFPMLCDNGVPRGDDIWEITRLCTAPQLRGREAWLARSYLAVGMVELALLYGIGRYTCVAETSWLSSIMAVGWECEPLGLPQEINGESVGALIINITPATLQLFRMKMGWRLPVLELDAIAKAA
ncbi:MAG: GNAT family N-acetyltransferase [Proteobacteria bacterium]|nr:GNAT family N-acetyltransferase [Pseudomonadota bacterium]